MPDVKPTETKNEYLQRCMSDSKMNSEFPDEGQRYAVCNSYWDKSKMSALDKYIKSQRDGKA